MLLSLREDKMRTETLADLLKVIAWKNYLIKNNKSSSKEVCQV